MRIDEFINKVNKQRGWIDEIDAWRLVDIYEEIPNRRNIDNMKVEDQLIYMYQFIIGRTKVNITTKKCASCGEVKELDSFYKDKKRPDGLSPRCAECTRKYINEWRNKKDKKDKNV